MEDEEENIFSEEQILETEIPSIVEEVSADEEIDLSEEPVAEVVDEVIIEPEPVDDFVQFIDDLISAEIIDQNELISNFLQSTEKPVNEVLSLVGENIPEMAIEVSVEVLNAFPKDILEFSQIIATAFPEIIEDIAVEAAIANPNDVNDIVSGMLLGSPAKAAEIVLSVIEAAPESAAGVTVSMATTAPELATEIAAEIVSQNPDLLGEVASAMFVVIPDQVEETIISLINLNNEFISELAEESLSFNNISPIVFDTILDISPESSSILTNNLMNSLNEEEAGVFIENLFEFNDVGAAEIIQNLITTDISFASSVVQAGSEQFVDFLSESLVANSANEDISQLTFEVAKNDPTFAAKFLNDISQLDNADMASINSSMAMELNQFSQSEFVNVGAKFTAEISQVNIDISGEMIAGMFLLDSNKATSFSAEVANNLNQDLNEQMLLNISNHVTRSDFINEFSTNISLLDDREFNEISKFKSNDLLAMANSFVEIDQMSPELQVELGSTFANGFNQDVMEFNSSLSEIRNEVLDNIEVFKATFNENVNQTKILEMFDVSIRSSAESYLNELDFFNYDMSVDSQVDTINFSIIQEDIKYEYLTEYNVNNLSPLALGLNNYTPQYVPENYQAGMSLYEGETITYEEEEYVYQESETTNSGDGGYSNAFWNDSSNTLVSSGSTIWYAQNIGNGFLGFSASEDFNYVGSNSQETINFYINRDIYSGKFTFNMYGGNDNISNAKFKNIDSLSLGSGDDNVSLKLGSTEDGYYGSPDLSNFSMSLLDGGPGSDTLNFSSTVVSGGAILNLSTGSATNFENIVGSSVNETLQGDANANILKGSGGLDTIYGYDGSDYLYGYGEAGLGSSGASLQSGNDILYGGGGDDYLFGTAGDNTLDGGTGTDTIYSGSGADSIILRTGDGSTTLSSANILTDFTDGSDVFLMDDFNSSQITIAQGTGSNEDHTLISITSTGEYLMKILNTLVAKITGADLSTTSTDPLTLNGSSGNDILIGGSGSDTFSGAAGSDEIYGHGGDDSITISGKSGSYTDTILGGSGTDGLSIAYSGITSLKNFTISTNGSTTSLVDSNGGTINFSSIENLTVNGRSYKDATDTPINSGDGGIINAYWGSNEKLIVSTGNTVWYAQNLNTFNTNNFTDYSVSDDLEYHGSSNQETINLYINRDSITGDFTFNMGGGNDVITQAKVKNSDSIDMGSGDDRLELKIGATVDGLWGSPNIGSLNVSNMDGGEGTDTLSFEQSKISDGTTLSLTSGGASNFENLTGSSANETLNGDEEDNILKGGGGVDTINGLAGDDYLYGYGEAGLGSSGASSQSGDDILNGGDGNDYLYGTAGNNTLDGGAGTDTIYTGSGDDVIILRANDGSTSLSSADTITDYIDNTDSFGMAGGLAFSDLTILQGTGSYSSDALIMITSSNEYLGIVSNTAATDLTTDDFAVV